MEIRPIRRRAAVVAGVGSVGLALVLGLVTAYDGANPVTITPGFETRDNGLSGAAVAMPAFAAIMSLIAGVLVLHSATRPAFSFATFAAVIGAVVVFSLPAHFGGVGPLAVTAVVLAIATDAAATIGWFGSPAVPDDPPRWPTHRG